MYKNQRVDWYRVNLNPGLLKQLSEPNDWKGFIQAGGHLGLVGVTGFTAYYVFTHFAWYWMIPALLLHGLVVTNLSAGVHELVHERVFKSGWLNHVFLYMISFLNWWNPIYFRLSHNEHHKYTLHPPDDLEVVLPLKITRSQLFRVCVADPLAPFYKIREQMRYLTRRYQGEWEQKVLGQADLNNQKRVGWWALTLLMGHGGILLVSLYYGQWIIPVVVTLGAYYGGGLAFLMHGSQHIGLMDKVDDFRLCCRTIYLNPVFRYLYWNMNYHTEHHMYPAVPFYRLPLLHEAIKAEMPTVRNGLIETWAGIADILVRQKYDPSYQHRASLPSDPVKSAGQGPETSQQPDTPMLTSKVWECNLCGFIYDESRGLPEEHIPAGTRWEDLPDTWCCPVCGVAKGRFHQVEIARTMTSSQPRSVVRSSASPIAVIGSGIAGYSLAREIRGIDLQSPLFILTADEGESYYKPSLSNALTTGEPVDDLVLADAKEMARRLHLEIHSQTAVREIDRGKKRLVTDKGEFQYGKLVLALGAEQAMLPLKDNRASGILTVNNLVDYRRFRSRLRSGDRVLIIGAGLIGCEFANDLALAGYPVEVVDIADSPLSQLIPSEIGQFLKSRLEAIGVVWHLGCSVQSVEEGVHRKFLCRLSDNSSLEGNLVLSAVGLRPKTELARRCGLLCGKGIQVDEWLRTSDPDIHAIGDCIEWGGQLRPYVQPILEAAPALARTILGSPTAVSFPVMPVIVKTPSCPIVAVPPESGSLGTWRFEQNAQDGLGRFYDLSNRLKGFVLAGGNVKRQEEMIQSLDAGRLVESPGSQ